MKLRPIGSEIYGLADDSYPLQKKKTYRRIFAQYCPSAAAYQQIRRRFPYSFRVVLCDSQIFHERGFRYVHTPIITASDCEGAGEMFQVTTLDLNNLPRTPDGKIDYSQDFFGKEARLTVSGQLNGEMYATALGDIYTFGPTFSVPKTPTPPVMRPSFG